VQRGIEGFRHKAARVTATRLSGCVMSVRHGTALTLLCASRAWEVFRRYNNWNLSFKSRVSARGSVRGRGEAVVFAVRPRRSRINRTDFLNAVVPFPADRSIDNDVAAASTLRWSKKLLTTDIPLFLYKIIVAGTILRWQNKLQNLWNKTSWTRISESDCNPCSNVAAVLLQWCCTRSVNSATNPCFTFVMINEVVV